MSNINLFVANASGKFSGDIVKSIGRTVKKVTPIVSDFLKISSVDIVFFPVEDSYQLGIYGYTPNAYAIHIYIDTKFDNYSEAFLESTLLHEFHHAKRWDLVGYGKTLGEEFVTEGLATLFEEQVTGVTPEYAKVKIKQSDVKRAIKLLNAEGTDHNEWFYGSKNIDNWFGYAFGYQMCKKFSEETGNSAAELVGLNAGEILSSMSVSK